MHSFMPGRKAVRPTLGATLTVLVVLAGAAPVVAAPAPSWQPSVGSASVAPVTARHSSTVRLSVVTRRGFGVLAARRTALGVVRTAGITSAQLAGPTQPAGSSFQLDVPVSGLASALALLRASGSVASVEPVHAMSLLDVPSDSLYDGDQKTYLTSLDLPKAWDVTHGSSTVRVAVIDSGVTTSHPDLAGKVVGRYNAVTGSSTVTDNVGHGTMVASMIAANTDNAAGIAGAGWDTDLLVVRVADSQNHIDDADVAEGVNWAVKHGAQVINLSLGGPAAGASLKTAIADAVDADVVVVAAAGNNGTTAKFYPAALPGVLSVGALSTTGGSRASFSEHGPWVDLAAPGVAIWGADRSGSGYQEGDGTSFASPLVAGIAALIRASRPSLSAAGVQTALTSTASTTKFGFAHGRVDAFKALGYHLVLPGPTVTSPQPTDAVGSTINVQVTVPSTVGADHVRASIVGRGSSVTAAVSGGGATFTLPAWGSDGSRVLRVVACRASLCSPTGTDVSVDVGYSAPILTAPSDGNHFITDWTASATSSSPAVRFLGDGTTVLATDTSAPFSANVALAKLTSAGHTITAVACNAAGTTCDSSAHASTGAAVTIAHLTPTISALTPSPFSPNGDRVLDKASLHYTLDRPQDVTVNINNVHGTLVRTLHLGTVSAGAHIWTWDGSKTGGGKAPTGTYTVHLATSALVSAETLTGSASRSLRLDVTKPSVTSVGTTYATVFPHRDGYRDSTVLSAHVSETAHVTLTVTKVTGATVFSAHLSRSGSGNAKATWRGTSSGGHTLAAGHYRFRFTATDTAGNVTKGAPHTIVVSSKKAVHRTWKKTVSAVHASGGHFQSSDGAGNVLHNDAFGKGALRFEPSSTGQVRTLNEQTLPSAVAYGSIRVDTYGRGLSGGRAFLAFIDDTGTETHGTTLSSSTGTHKGKSASATSSLLDGHKAEWDLVVSHGDVYDVRSFTVTLTYLVLV